MNMTNDSLKKISLTFILTLFTSITPVAYAASEVDQARYEASLLEWQCQVKQTTPLYQDKVIWQTLSCVGHSILQTIKDLNINLVYVPVNDPDIKLLPYSAQTEDQLATLPEIAASLAAHQEKLNVIAGINGGYYYRINADRFLDTICMDKNINHPKLPNSMGDSLLQYDGQNYAANCAFIPGIRENARASLILTGTNPITHFSAPYITYVKPDTSYIQDMTFPDAMGAGPNLITNGKVMVNNPNEDLQLSALEFSANTAVGIINDAQGHPAKMVFFTVDGNDESRKKHWPGMNAYQMASFLLNYVKVADAMSMDQGRSTTMYVAASDPAVYPFHVVSNANYEPNQPVSERKVRRIYDGLFIAVKKAPAS